MIYCYFDLDTKINEFYSFASFANKLMASVSDHKIADQKSDILEVMRKRFTSYPVILQLVC